MPATAHPPGIADGDQPVRAIERVDGEAILALAIRRELDRLVEVERRDFPWGPLVVRAFAGAGGVGELDPGRGDIDVGPRVVALARHQLEVAAPRIPHD